MSHLSTSYPALSASLRPPHRIGWFYGNFHHAEQPADRPVQPPGDPGRPRQRKIPKHRSDLVSRHRKLDPLSEASGILSPSPSLYPAPTATCGLATASMILGISGFLLLITAIPAVICGHIARGKIKFRTSSYLSSSLMLALLC